MEPLETKPAIKPKSKTAFFILIGLSTAILLAAPVLGLTGIGFLLDKLFKTTPVITIVGLCIGFVGGIYNVWKLLKNLK